MKVLVTGGTSLLGRRVVERLLVEGEDVRVLQRGASGLPCQEYRVDVRDQDAVQAAVAGVDTVLHLAAKVDVVGPWRDFHEVNVVATRALLAAGRRSGVARLVYVSSPSVAHAGRPVVGAPAEPADPDRARGPYARSKAMAERAVLTADGPDVQTLAVRPHLVWGPGDRQLVERIVARGRAHRLPSVGPGAALVDTTYIDNAAAALVAASRAGVHGRALVVSNGEPRPIGEMLAALCAAAGVPGPRGQVPVRAAWLAGAVAERVWSAGGRSTDPPLTSFLVEQLSTAHWFDQRETRRLLGWEPAVSVDSGLARLEEWYRERDSPLS